MTTDRIDGVAASFELLDSDLNRDMLEAAFTGGQASVVALRDLKQRFPDATDKDRHAAFNVAAQALGAAIVMELGTKLAWHFLQSVSQVALAASVSVEVEAYEQDKGKAH